MKKVLSTQKSLFGDVFRTLLVSIWREDSKFRRYLFLFIFIIGKQTIVDIKHNVDQRPSFHYYIRIIFNSGVYHVTDQSFSGQHLVSSICRTLLFIEEYYAVWPINTDYVK